MRRREFITLLGGTTAAWPLATRAQQPAMPVIGYFSGRSFDSESRLLPSFHKGLAEAGFIIDQNIAVEYRFSNGDDHQLPVIAADWVRRQPAVIVATYRPSAVAARAATSTIPIVFSSGVDPVDQGLVATLNRPGGNATGVAVFTSELGPKRLELLRELVPNNELVAFVVNPQTRTSPAQIREVQAAAQAVGQKILVVNASTPSEVDAAFATMVEQRAGAVLYSAHVFFQVVRDQLVALAVRHAIPAMYEWREFVAAGGLVSYSTNRSEAFRQIGLYTGQILKGARPGDLPVVRPTKFELVINLKTAKVLGLEVPPMLLARADELIE